MTGHELSNQELNRHEEKIDQNVERNQDLNLEQKTRGIAADNQNSAVTRLVHIVYYLFSVVELVLIVRVILHVFGANSDNGFARLIDVVSSPFVALFATLLDNPTLGTTAVLEITTLIAILVWAIVAWLIARLVWLVMSRPDGIKG